MSKAEKHTLVIFRKSGAGVGVHVILSIENVSFEDCFAQKSARHILNEQNTVSSTQRFNCAWQFTVRRCVFNPNELWRWEMKPIIYSSSKMIPIKSIHAQPVKCRIIYRNIMIN